MAERAVLTHGWTERASSALGYGMFVLAGCLLALSLPHNLLGWGFLATTPFYFRLSKPVLPLVGVSALIMTVRLSFEHALDPLSAIGIASCLLLWMTASDDESRTAARMATAFPLFVIATAAAIVA